MVIKLEWTIIFGVYIKSQWNVLIDMPKSLVLLHGKSCGWGKKFNIIIRIILLVTNKIWWNICDWWGPQVLYVCQNLDAIATRDQGSLSRTRHSMLGPSRAINGYKWPKAYFLFYRIVQINLIWLRGNGIDSSSTYIYST